MLELDEVQQLRDDALIQRLSLSVRKDRGVAVGLLVEMGEVMERGLYRDLGFSSMFEFATRRLGMSEAEAVLRIRAAKVGRSFPVALEMLGRCEVNLTTLSLLSSVLSQESLHLLYAARHKSKQEVVALIATHRPVPDAPDSVRRLPRPRTSARARGPDSTRPTPVGLSDVQSSTNLWDALATTHDVAPQQATPPQTAEATHAQTASLTPPQTPEPTAPHTAKPLPPNHHPQPSAATVRQLSADRHRISFTASQRVRDLLQEAQDLRRHLEPGGDLERLFERALELLVAEEKKRKFALTAKPRADGPPSVTHSRYIPHALRRQVWARDAGQCCYIAPDGLRCAARSRLEFHHVRPFARGGPTSADNVLLLCRAHNALYAERDYGPAFVRERIAGRAGRTFGVHGVSGNEARMIPEGDRHGPHAVSGLQQPRAP